MMKVKNVAFITLILSSNPSKKWNKHIVHQYNITLLYCKQIGQSAAAVEFNYKFFNFSCMQIAIHPCMKKANCLQNAH